MLHFLGAGGHRSDQPQMKTRNKFEYSGYFNT